MEIMVCVWTIACCWPQITFFRVQTGNFGTSIFIFSNLPALRYSLVCDIQSVEDLTQVRVDLVHLRDSLLGLERLVALQLHANT